MSPTVEPVRTIWGLVKDGDWAGPVHGLAVRLGGFQAWCGTRKQLRHLARAGDQSDVTCVNCLKALAAGRPMARRARR